MLLVHADIWLSEWSSIHLFRRSEYLNLASVGAFRFITDPIQAAFGPNKSPISAQSRPILSHKRCGGGGLMCMLPLAVLRFLISTFIKIKLIYARVWPWSANLHFLWLATALQTPCYCISNISSDGDVDNVFRSLYTGCTLSRCTTS